jgi:hypothetical protein
VTGRKGAPCAREGCALTGAEDKLRALRPLSLLYQEHAPPGDSHTLASFIAELHHRRMRVAVGPACEHQYMPYMV